MSNIHRLPDIAVAEQEASEWIARLHADDVTSEDLARFEEWRAAHPRHARAYEEISASLNEVKLAGHIVRAVSFGNAMNAASDLSHKDVNTHAASSSYRLRIAAAAAIAVIAFATTWWMTRSVPQTVFQTAIGEHASVELPDGSRLDLNSNSAAQVEYSEHARTIRLTRGEAFFKVAHQPQRPFWVVAGASWIRAVGTQFNVDLRPMVVRVVVSEGVVKVARSRTSGETPSDVSLAQASVSVLTAGQQAEMMGSIAKIRSVEPVELTRLAAWRAGKLYFENQHLQAVVEELGRYTNARIVIEDEALKQMSIGGTFQANSQGVEALLNMLERGLRMRVRRESGGDIYIESAAPEECDLAADGTRFGC